jgi:hypothetical protein
MQFFLILCYLASVKCTSQLLSLQMVVIFKHVSLVGHNRYEFAILNAPVIQVCCVYGLFRIRIREVHSRLRFNSRYISKYLSFLYIFPRFLG